MSFDFLEDFGSPIVAPEPVQETAPVNPMQGYESGFQAGWDDAMASVSENRDHISAEFARNLQELSFSFHEARQQVTSTVRPFLAALVESLLPLTADQALVENIWAKLEPILNDHNTPSVQLLCAASDVDTLEQLTAVSTTMAINVVAEPSLMEGQVKFSIEAEQHEIDMSHITDEIRALIASAPRATPLENTNEVQYAG